MEFDDGELERRREHRRLDDAHGLRSAAGAGALLQLLRELQASPGEETDQRQQNEKASALLAAARVVATAQVTALPTINSPAVGSGTYATETARDEAAVKKFQEAAEAYPKTQAGITARYQGASLLAELGKVAEAEQAYNEVIRLDGNGLHGRMARLGVAALQLRAGKVDPAIQTLQELSQRTAMFHLGNLVEENDTDKMFTNPDDQRTQDYIMGRFG